MHSKTIVFFAPTEIEKILSGVAKLGDVFEEKLREVYDYIFEENHNPSDG